MCGERPDTASACMGQAKQVGTDTKGTGDKGQRAQWGRKCGDSEWPKH